MDTYHISSIVAVVVAVPVAVARVRSEHASIASQLGALPESVAKVAAASIQRVEESFVGAMAARCKEFDKSAAV